MADQVLGCYRLCELNLVQFSGSTTRVVRQVDSPRDATPFLFWCLEQLRTLQATLQPAQNRFSHNQPRWLTKPFVAIDYKNSILFSYRVYTQSCQTGRLPSGCYLLPVLVPGAVEDSPGHLATCAKQV